MGELYQLLDKTSKYTYTFNESDEELFVFEITLKKNNDKPIKLHKIKKSRSGILLSSKDNINYNEIKSIVISIIDVNNPVKEINVNCILNQSNKHNIIFNTNIFIELFNNESLLESNYNILIN